MILKKPLKTFLFPAANIILSLFLFGVFFTAGQSIVRTFYPANISSLANLSPNPINYFWDLNIYNAPLNKSRVRYYADYFEHLLKVFPSVRDAYGVLGYCYHFLGDDTKAIDYLKKAIEYNPLYIWNYYNLAAIYMHQYRYQETAILLEKIQFLYPQASLQRMLESPYVYDRLIAPGGKGAIDAVSRHMSLCYRVSLDLVQLLVQAPNNIGIQKALKKVNLELYAF